MPGKPASRTQKKIIAENKELRARLEEAEEILRAIGSGTVDALIVSGKGGERIFTLEQAEFALAESEEKFRRLVERLPSIVYMNAMDDVHSHLYVSQQITIQLGYSPEEWLSDPKLWLKILHPEDRQHIQAQAAAADRTKEPFDMEYRMVARDGHLVWVHDQSILVKDLKGRPKFRQGIMLDITSRRQAETEIHQRLSELEVLYQSGLALSQLVNLKDIAQMMIDLLDQKMNWHHTAVRLYDAQSETFELLVFNQPSLNSETEREAVEERLKTSVTRLDGGFTGWVIQHGVTVRSNDLKNDTRYFETFPGLQSGLYVPIKTKERVLGVISIESELAQAFSESDERLASTLAMQAAIAMENAQLFESLKHSNIDLELAYDATIEGWSYALDLRDKETEGHSQRVTEMTVNLARTFGLSETELVQVRWGSLLHDIGKMGIPDDILLKPGPLTEAEWAAMRKHPRFAYDLLSPIRYLRLALDIPYCHHEKWDGTGYPRGLKGEQIPLTARIFAVVDVWDALRSDRPYRAAWAEEKVYEHILALSGTHFDPQVVDIFMQMSKKLSNKTKKRISRSATLES